MSSPKVLSLFDFSKPFTIKIDASGIGIGVVIQQDGRPIPFMSKALGPRNHFIEVDVLCAVKKWQSYLARNHFIIKIDYHSLKYFFQNKAHMPFQQKWVSKLLGFDHEIVYREVRDQMADAF